MAVQIPPWISIDPIAPAHIVLAANAQRNQAEASARSAAMQQEEMDVRREQAQTMAAQAQRALEQQKQEHEAKQAQQLAEFQLTNQIHQEASKRAALEASIQMQGQTELQQSLDAGVPLDKAFAAAAPKLLWKHPNAIAPSIKSITPPAAPQPGVDAEGRNFMYGPTGTPVYPPRGVTPAQTGPITAQDIVDQSGNPVGVQAFRGANGAVHPLRPQSITLEGRIRVLTASAAIIKSQIDASPSQAITESLLKKQANILAQLDDLLTKKEAIAPPRAAVGNRDALLKEAEDAIARGADRTAVYKRLKEMGVTKGEPIRPVYQAPDEQPTEDQFDEQP